MTTPFAQAFSREALLAFAGERSFERGVAYTTRVKRLSVDDREATASVRGTRTYRVRLWLEDDVPLFSCTCPVADDGLFCKHCVAVGLVAIGEGAAGRAEQRRFAADEVRAYLEGVDKARLVDLLLAQADDDELLRARLGVEAIRARALTDDVRDLSDYRRAIGRAIDPHGFVDYHSMYAYARGIEEVIDSLDDLLAAGFSAQAIDLCEHALTCLEDALGSVDDSDGQMTDIRDRLCEVHHAACVVARPDPVALAERLCDWELRSEWETFFGAAAVYADVLGDAGLAAYRRRAEEVWAGTRPLGPGDESEFFTGRFAITHVMETLAELSGDIDELIAVKAHDLSSPYGFAEIAEVCRDAGRHDEALDWTERGVAAYPECLDTRLLEILAEEYEGRGRDEEAVLVMWSLLERHPVLDSYQRLKAHAVKAGAWEVWRTKALDCLRDADTPRLDAASIFAGMGGLAGPVRSHTHSHVGWPAGRSCIVEALLWEGDAEAAWQEAVAGGCSTRLWMQLAAVRAVDHPGDALPIYVREVERLIDLKNRRGYEESVELLHTVRELMARLERSDDFSEYLAALRDEHRRKRSLMTLLNQAQWS